MKKWTLSNHGQSIRKREDLSSLTRSNSFEWNLVYNEMIGDSERRNEVLLPDVLKWGRIKEISQIDRRLIRTFEMKVKGMSACRVHVKKASVFLK